MELILASGKEEQDPEIVFKTMVEEKQMHNKET